MKPIATAPKDGTPILTEFGIVHYRKAVDFRTQSKIEGWFCCCIKGYTLTYGQDNDFKLVQPTMWTLLPEFKIDEVITKENICSLGFLPSGEETEFSYHIWDQEGPEDFHFETYDKEPLFELVWLVEENKVFLEVSLGLKTLQAIVLPTLTFQELKTLVQILSSKAS